MEHTTHHGPTADRVHRARSVGDPFLHDVKRRMASAILSNTIEAFFTTAILNMSNGRVYENQIVQQAREAVADHQFTDRLYAALDLSQQGRRGAARAFQRLSAMRVKALRAAARDPKARLIAKKDATKNIVHIRLLKLYGATRAKGVYLAAQNLGVDVRQFSHNRTPRTESQP